MKLLRNIVSSILIFFLIISSCFASVSQEDFDEVYNQLIVSNDMLKQVNDLLGGDSIEVLKEAKSSLEESNKVIASLQKKKYTISANVVFLDLNPGGEISFSYRFLGGFAFNVGVGFVKPDTFLWKGGVSFTF